jgi:hypothetical protein
VLFESTTDRHSVNGTLLLIGQWSAYGLVLVRACLCSLTRHGRLEPRPRLTTKEGSLRPGLVRRPPAGAVWSCRGVGFEARADHVFVGPGYPTLPGRLILGPHFQRADRCFDCPIVLWQTGRREQWNYPDVLQKRLHGVGSKRRTVIAFQHQGRPLYDEQRRQRPEHRFRCRRHDGLPEKLLAAGQIPHRQQIGIATVDGRQRTGKVDGPDATRHGPVQHAQGLAIAQPPDTAVAPEQVGQFGAGAVGEASLLGRQTERRTPFIEQRDHVLALVTGRAQRRSAEQGKVRRSQQQVVLPVAQRARRYP